MSRNRNKIPWDIEGFADDMSFKATIELDMEDLTMLPGGKSHKKASGE